MSATPDTGRELTAADIAGMFCVSPATVSKWRQRHPPGSPTPCPQPEGRRIGSSRLWLGTQEAEWLAWHARRDQAPAGKPGPKPAAPSVPVKVLLRPELVESLDVWRAREGVGSRARAVAALVAAGLAARPEDRAC